ncbi:MAG: ketopantoate reductase family protein [Pseudomonadota bacterium]|nr:ketopantoate reductase family protein [Pseudomonadota bacterium]
MIDKIHIIGAGAIGAVYGALLSDMDPRCVSFVASGERRERLRKEGIAVNGREYLIPVLDSGETHPAADLLIVAVKHYHLDQAIAEMKSSIGAGTIIMSLMNGIDSEERIGAVYGKEKLLYAVVVGIDALRQDNRVVYTNQGKIFFGEREASGPSDRVRRVRELFDRAGIYYVAATDIMRDIWWKFMINVGINQASAVTGGNYRVFQQAGPERELMNAAMREVITLARKLGIVLTSEDMERWHAVLATLGPEGKTSMLQDVEAGRKTEVEMLSGVVLALGRRHDVAVPVNESLYRQIREIEGKKGKN